MCCYEASGDYEAQREPSVDIELYVLTEGT